MVHSLQGSFLCSVLSLAHAWWISFTHRWTDDRRERLTLDFAFIANCLLLLRFPQIVICRRPLLYVVSLLIPSIVLVFVDLGSFYLPPNSSMRITFKSSILVGYTIFKVNMSSELPSTAVGTPLIS